jgi:hypothetical protein
LDKNLNLLDFTLPKFYNTFQSNTDYGIIWKINVKEIISDDCYVKFTVKKEERVSSLTIKNLFIIVPIYNNQIILIVEFK